MSKLISHENNKAVFTEIIKKETFKEKIQEAYKRNKSRFNIPGFRKGKAPKKIIEANYGKEVFYSDALDLIIPEIYESAIEELDIKPVSQPSVDFDNENKLTEDEDLVLRFEVETYPEFELSDYSTIEIEEQDNEVSDDDIDAKIQEQIEQNKVISPVEREIGIGDIVNIDFEGFKDGESFEGGKAEGYDLKVGSKTFIPGFEEALVGKKKGEEVDVDITFPEDYQAEDLKGEDVVFKVKINDISEEIYPELDDEFVKDISEFDTLDEYKDSLKEELQKELEENNKIELENQVIEEVIRRTDIDLPSQMIEDQLNNEVHEYEHQISHMGMDMDTYLQITGASMDDIRDQLRERAENKVKIDLILEKIVDEKEYDVTDEEIEEEYQTVLSDYGKEDDEEFLKLVKAQVREEDIRTILQRRKAIEEFKDNVVFVERKEEVEEDEEAEENEDSKEDK